MLELINFLSICYNLRFKHLQWAKELGIPIVMHNYLKGGFAVNISLATYCCHHDLLLYIHFAMQALLISDS
jgi:ribulose-bisphosphate carboxylase large chain